MLPADVLTAVHLLEPSVLSRNRHFALHASAEGMIARRRAARVRGIVRQITGAHGPARLLALEPVSSGDYLLRYRLAKIALERSTHVNAIDLSLLRVALARAGARLLPSALKASEDDHARVIVLLSRAAEASRAAAARS